MLKQSTFNRVCLSAACCIVILNSATYGQNGCRKGDCINGFGVYYFSTGDRYEGTWENGIMQGYGKWTSGNGDSYEGEYEDDVENGLGIFFWMDGYYYAGQFSDGLKNGYGIEYNDEGQVSGMGKWLNEVFVNDYSDSEGIYQFQKMGVKLSEIVSDKQNLFKNLRGETIKSPLTGKSAWASTIELQGFEMQCITEEGHFEGVMGRFSFMPELQFYGLITTVVSWAAQSDYFWQFEEGEPNGAPTFVCSVSSSKASATNNLDGMTITIYVKHSGDYSLILEIT